MALTKEEIKEIRTALDTSARPLFIFDGDTDGLASFTLLYKRKGDGKGVMNSGRPYVGPEYLRRVEEYQPDAIFILDLAMVSQEFIDGIKIPIIWLDHHDPHQELKLPKHVKQYNPRLHDDEDNRPTSYWAYKVVQEWLWIAMTGIIGDYAYELVDEFRKDYPDLLPESADHQSKALFDTPLGKLIRIMESNLKGSVSSSMTSVKIFTRIDDPYEILEQKSARGRYLYRKYERVMRSYTPLFQEACKEGEKAGDYLIYTYTNGQYSFSGDLANELKYRYPKKIVIIGRRHEEKVMLSLRSEQQDIIGPLQEALSQVSGHGGGHPKACGAMVPEAQLDEFLRLFTESCNKTQGI